MISKAGGDASHGPHRVVAPMLIKSEYKPATMQCEKKMQTVPISAWDEVRAPYQAAGIMTSCRIFLLIFVRDHFAVR